MYVDETHWKPFAVTIGGIPYTVAHVPEGSGIHGLMAESMVSYG
jgi:hypothetical protein